VAVAVAAALWWGRGRLLPPVARFLDVSEPPAPADCVYVLGGGLDSRPFAAAAVYKAGLARRVVIPTVRPDADALDGLGPAESDVTRRVLLARGVPAEAIVQLPGEVNSTADEARCLARYLEDHPGWTVAVVTTDFHTRRTRWIFRRTLGDRVAGLRLVGVPHERFGPDDWWRHEYGVMTYLDEYGKLAYYLARY
jgi:uncharacterized SAM-binding protein YcdF (DUF218 family)